MFQNLKPRKLAGVPSEGMILFASKQVSEDQLELDFLEIGDMEVGQRIGLIPKENTKLDEAEEMMIQK